jgi:hypothetical protein
MVIGAVPWVRFDNHFIFRIVATRNKIMRRPFILRSQRNVQPDGRRRGCGDTRPTRINAMIVLILILLICFCHTWFIPLPQPFFIILCIIEGIALLLLVVPYAPLRGGLW